MWGLRILVIVFIGTLGALKVHEATSWSHLQPLREQAALWLIGDLEFPMGLYDDEEDQQRTSLTTEAVEAEQDYLPTPPMGGEQQGRAAPRFEYRCVFLAGPRLAAVCRRGLPGSGYRN